VDGFRDKAMSIRGLSKKKSAELVQRFATLAAEQDVCLLENDISGANRLFDRMQEIVTELKGRPGDQRVALMDLYAHSNMQVRLKAAKNTLAVAPQAARETARSDRCVGLAALCR
jgi:hypothetical protein